jgi:hypothetical protein
LLAVERLYLRMRMTMTTAAQLLGLALNLNREVA